MLPSIKLKHRESDSFIGDLAMVKLTIRSVSTLKINEKEYFTWDDELPCFGIRVKPSGVKSFLIQYRDENRRTRRMTIGRVGVLSPEKARSKAKILLGKIEDGANPSEDRQKKRSASTISELSEQYLTEHAEVKKRPRSIKSDKDLLRLHILPAFGPMKASAVSRNNVIRLHHSMRKTPGAANRTLSLFSKMMNLAEKWGIRPDGSNPCRHVERYPERKMERYLSTRELAHLGKVLAEAERTKTEMPSVIAAIRLLTFTGCRAGEILNLQWSHVDVENACLRIPTDVEGTKPTGAKNRIKVVHLNSPALEVLNGIEKTENCSWVIAGKNPGSPLINIRKPWHRIRDQATVNKWPEDDECIIPVMNKLAEDLGRKPALSEIMDEANEKGIKIPVGLTDLRIHDLRHSFASIGAGGGLSLPMIGALLGHTQAATTARYAHLAADPLKQATNFIGGRIAAAMNSEKTAGSVELKKI
jgi:integrase